MLPKLPPLAPLPCPGKNYPSFPTVLHKMLEELELVKKQQSHRIIGWEPHGRSFNIWDREAFVKTILPMWFKMRSYASFQRQLNIYGFERIGSGDEKGGYFHHCFLRGEKDLAKMIPRQKKKGKGHRKPAPPPPNFYKLPFMKPTPKKEQKEDEHKKKKKAKASAVVPPEVVSSCAVVVAEKASIEKEGSLPPLYSPPVKAKPATKKLTLQSLLTTVGSLEGLARISDLAKQDQAAPAGMGLGYPHSLGQQQEQQQRRTSFSLFAGGRDANEAHQVTAKMILDRFSLSASQTGHQHTPEGRPFANAHYPGDAFVPVPYNKSTFSTDAPRPMGNLNGSYSSSGVLMDSYGSLDLDELSVDDLIVDGDDFIMEDEEDDLETGNVGTEEEQQPPMPAVNLSNAAVVEQPPNAPTNIVPPGRAVQIEDPGQQLRGFAELIAEVQQVVQGGQQQESGARVIVNGHDVLPEEPRPAENQPRLVEVHQAARLQVNEHQQQMQPRLVSPVAEQNQPGLFQLLQHQSDSQFDSSSSFATPVPFSLDHFNHAATSFSRNHHHQGNNDAAAPSSSFRNEDMPSLDAESFWRSLL